MLVLANILRRLGILLIAASIVLWHFAWRLSHWPWYCCPWIWILAIFSIILWRLWAAEKKEKKSSVNA